MNGQADTPTRYVNPDRLRDAPGILALFEALNSEARFVGGCVRDLLLDQVPGDIDIATPWQPESVMKRLESAGFNCHPTGIAHGTVLAVTPDKRGQYEVTTLRRDIETDGRRARVSFTQDYREDALRRDLTFNAMSLERDGALYDYFCGLEDLSAGRVRFVGEAEERIVEDRLRILRYFRFFARYGAVEPDSETQQALLAQMPGIGGLSGERLNAELSKMLVGPRPVQIVTMMQDYGLIQRLLGRPLDIEGLRRLVGLEGALNAADVQRRFAVLLSRSRARIDYLADRFRWPNRDRQRMRLMAEGALPPLALEPMIYRFGTTAAKDWLLLNATSLNNSINPQLWETALNWRAPSFPLKGQHLIDAGYPPGPTIGQIRLVLEEWWIANDFRPQLPQILAQLAKMRDDAQIPAPE